MKALFTVLGIVVVASMLTNCQSVSSGIAYVHATSGPGTMHDYGAPPSLFTGTGLFVHRGQQVTIDFCLGGWNTNPEFAWDGPLGHVGTKASSAYPMPGYRKGMMITRVGRGRLIPWTGHRLTFIADDYGEIEMGINDLYRDPAGLNNSGQLTMQVSIHPLRSSPGDVYVEDVHYYYPNQK